MRKKLPPWALYRRMDLPHVEGTSRRNRFLGDDQQRVDPCDKQGPTSRGLYHAGPYRIVIAIPFRPDSNPLPAHTAISQVLSRCVVCTKRSLTRGVSFWISRAPPKNVGRARSSWKGKDSLATGARRPH